MNKQIYISPSLSSVRVDETNMLASSIRNAAGNADFVYGGISDETARVKQEDSSSFWED